MERKILKKLLSWKDRAERKPLLLNGARQVGKTYILQKLGREHFENMVYVNLEKNLTMAGFFQDNIDPGRIIRYLEASTQKKITPGKTLLVLDEIQACERALTSLKYFCEEAPGYHVAAAGSLLGVAIHRERYSFPVGKIETLTLHPFDFEEYLMARNKTFLLEEIRNSFCAMRPLPDALHQEAVELYREYLVTGGMPASIDSFLRSNSFLNVPDVQGEIVNNYVADMAKYADNTESVRIRACFQSVPAQLAKDNKKFQYKVVQRGGSAALFGSAIEWLAYAGVVLKCRKTSHAEEPLSVYADLSSFKLYMADVGLLVMQSGISQATVLSGADSTFMGAVTENYVAQQFSAKGYPLYYWANKGTAELDFLLQKEGDIIGVEVKKGEHTKSRSLNVFINEYKPAYSIRLSLKNFGESNGVKAIPLYAAFCI